MIADDRENSKDRSQERRELSWQVLDSLTAGIAVLDQSGTILAVNDAWKQFCFENEGSPEKTGIGVNYLEVCHSAKGEDSELAERAGRGIEEVLNGTRDVFKLEYPCHSRTQQRWFLLYVSRLKDNTQGVVTVHLSITDRKLVERQLVESERLAAIGQAMEGLSHEGRNALQRAQASIDLLRFHVLQDYEALKLVERIENAQRHLLSLYEEVRSYAAPIRLNRKRCRLDQLVQQVWVNIACRSTEARFSHVPSSDDLTCEADAAAISEILQLVFENALTSAHAVTGDPGFVHPRSNQWSCGHDGCHQ